MTLLADACAFLDDTERAALLYEQLERYGHRMVVGPIEIALGSAARPLGKLAATLGRPEQAARWFEHAAAENERAGATPWAAHARLDHARLLLAQGKHAAAEPLFEDAAASYRQLGMEAWASRCRPSASRTAAPARL
jgi:tetratricopeptide (TPR) repeat protein